MGCIPWLKFFGFNIHILLKIIQKTDQEFFFYICFGYNLHGIMDEKEALIMDKKKLTEIKQELTESMEKYIDQKLDPVMKYFKKKKDFYEMSFL